MNLHRSAEERAFEKLVESPLYQTYRTAFHLATGLTVDLRFCGDEDKVDTGMIRDGNPFCRALNEGEGCSGCRAAHRDLGQRSVRGAHSLKCFAGLKETAIPVRNGVSTVALLRLGQTVEEEPDEAVLEAAGRRFDFEVTEAMRKLYAETPVVLPERYLGCVMLLNAFALQLGEELNRFMLAEENADPPTISRAKQYLNAHLDEKISLDAVAEHVHVSPYYFCKLFKQSTGMTLTEYVNRRRVEWAKRKLLNPQARVTEIAYDVGYQSLSQFNRSFLKYVGQSPTQYREVLHHEGALTAA